MIERGKTATLDLMIQGDPNTTSLAMAGPAATLNVGVIFLMFGNFLSVEVEPLAAPKLFSIGGLDVTNAMFFGVITAAALVGLLVFAARASKLHPKSKFAFTFETLIDFLWGAAEDTLGNRKTALKHLPLLATLFTFILLGNLSGSGLLPGVGTITATTGDQVTPLLRPFTTDLNATLAMAILTIGLVQFLWTKTAWC